MLRGSRGPEGETRRHTDRALRRAMFGPCGHPWRRGRGAGWGASALRSPGKVRSGSSQLHVQHRHLCAASEVHDAASKFQMMRKWLAALGDQEGARAGPERALLYPGKVAPSCCGMTGATGELTSKTCWSVPMKHSIKAVTPGLVSGDRRDRVPAFGTGGKGSRRIETFVRCTGRGEQSGCAPFWFTRSARQVASARPRALRTPARTGSARPGASPCRPWTRRPRLR